MEVSKFLYVALVTFNLMLFTLGPSILFHDQFYRQLTSLKIGERQKQVTARYTKILKSASYKVLLYSKYTATLL